MEQADGEWDETDFGMIQRKIRLVMSLWPMFSNPEWYSLSPGHEVSIGRIGYCKEECRD